MNRVPKGPISGTWVTFFSYADCCRLYRSRVAALGRALAPCFALGENPSSLSEVPQWLEVSDVGCEACSIQEVICHLVGVGGGCGHVVWCECGIG